MNLTVKISDEDKLEYIDDQIRLLIMEKSSFSRRMPELIDYEIEKLKDERKCLIEKMNASRKSGVIFEAKGNIINTGEIHASQDQIVGMKSEGDIKYVGKIKFLEKGIENFSSKHPWWFLIISVAIGYVLNFLVSIFFLF